MRMEHTADSTPGNSPLQLGIDTGGTYTDAALLCGDSSEVVATAKALTTPADLALGITEALSAVLARAGQAAKVAERVDLVSLSTTLATNALVQGHGHRTTLFLIGYNADMIEKFDLARRLAADDLVFLEGGHDSDGTEVASLDDGVVRRHAVERLNEVESFAVSGYFAVRNPEHELRVRQVIEEVSGGAAAVTCGHELTAELDSIRRATTVALNARLIPLIRRLIADVQSSLGAIGIAAPLMIVKGNGTLVQAEWAAARPIETILSGPAASVVGASHLAAEADGCVVDMGGTTTDITMVRDGLPGSHPEGGLVGGWRPMVETVDVHTVGLGGDSLVLPDSSASGGRNGIRVGPGRVVPLSLLGSTHEGVVAELERQVRQPPMPALAAQFAFLRGDPARVPDSLDWLNPAPRSLAAVAEASPYGVLSMAALARLEAELAVQRAGFTPTDALHALGEVDYWDVASARAAAAVLASQLELSPGEFCEAVIAAVSRKLTGEVVVKIVNDEAPTRRRAAIDDEIMARSVGAEPASDLRCQLHLNQPLVVVGAPATAYAPRAATHLNARLVIPTHAAVAGAIGAVASRIVQHCRVAIRSTGTEGVYLVLMPTGAREVASVAEGLEQARQLVPAYLEERMRAAGAANCDVQIARNDHSVETGYGGDGRVFVETELVFTAEGRPEVS
jgi:N-methylhydantoinase A/oxoprolinase/acetone carboxylase beta subunit